MMYKIDVVFLSFPLALPAFFLFILFPCLSCPRVPLAVGDTPVDQASVVRYMRAQGGSDGVWQCVQYSE